MIISSTTDIATWIDNTRADVRETGGQAAVDAAVATWSEDAESTARCGCGEVTGEACGWCGPAADLVTVETMPEHLRASHEAAGNRGTYPHNGAVRLRVSPECAAILVDGDEGWTREVSP